MSNWTEEKRDYNWLHAKTPEGKSVLFPINRIVFAEDNLRNQAVVHFEDGPSVVLACSSNELWDRLVK